MKPMRFKGFENISMNIVLQRDFLELYYGKVFTRAEKVKLMLKCITEPFFPRENYRLSSNHSKVLFFFSNLFRKNVKENSFAISSIVPSDIISTNIKVKSFHFLIGLNLVLRYIPQWNREVKVLGYSFYERLFVVQDLLTLFWLNRYLRDINLSEYNLVVTYNDSLVWESYVVELAKINGAKTATLQHGQFVSWTADTFMDCGIEFKTFKSDYFLCWNQFTYDEAVKSGIEPNKLVITGIWSYINKSLFCESEIHENNDVFGVVIGHPDWDEENKQLINAANVLSLYLKKRYILKLHPLYTIDAFLHIVNDYCITDFNSISSVVDYSKNVEFSLVGSSSVFIELVYLKHDLYRYSSGNSKDKYANIKIGKVFHEPKDVVSIYDSQHDKDYSKQLFDYLCTVDDVKKEYKNFLSRFL